MLWSIDSCQKGYPLTSITWPYSRLRCHPHRGQVFFEVIRWQVTSFQMIAGSSLFFKKPWPKISRIRRQLQNFIIYFILAKRPLWWTIFKNGNKKFHRALLYPKNPKVPITPRRPPTTRKNNEKFCNFANSVRGNALNSRCAIWILVKEPFVF